MREGGWHAAAIAPEDMTATATVTLTANGADTQGTDREERNGYWLLLFIVVLIAGFIGFICWIVATAPPRPPRSG